MDELIICDAGFPIPVGVCAIDISLKNNQPTTLEILAEIFQHFSVEKIVLAEETHKHSPTMFARLTGLFEKMRGSGNHSTYRFQSSQPECKSCRPHRRFQVFF